MPRTTKNRTKVSADNLLTCSSHSLSTETSAIAEASARVKECEVSVKQLTRLVRRDNEFNEGEQRRQSGLEVLFGDVIQLRHAQTQLFLRVSQTHSAKLNHTNVLLELSPTNDRGSMFKITPRNKVRSEGEPVLEGSQVLFAVQIGIEQYISRAGVFDRTNGKSRDHTGITDSLFQPTRCCALEIPRPVSRPMHSHGYPASSPAPV